ncbi:ATP-dependent zinc metalloprotease yme1l [Periplaneta americana]|uniref:ATP-dependent zinc metalloprotease yme1l n=1 Tax=Periplaneta americana TaxID=6978 RepID=A0ABQ8TD70_PERAM|nr:ATP-dependent zinc metalloprotease yme1l [Periplaneta americana]
MFTLQNNNQNMSDIFQVLFHLTQFTSAALNSRRSCSPLSPGTKSNRPQQCTLSQNEDFDIICSHSLNTVISNCKEFTLKHLPSIKGGCTDRLASWLFWNQLTARPLSKTKITLPWQVTYTSSETFFENKHGFPQSNAPYTNSSISISVPEKCARKLLFSALVGRPFSFDIHVRGFKTERSITAERLRNPTISARMRDALGFSYTGVSTGNPPGIVSSGMEKLGGVHQADLETDKIKGKLQPLLLFPCSEQYFVLSLCLSIASILHSADDGRDAEHGGAAAHEGGVCRRLPRRHWPACAGAHHEVAQDHPAAAHHRHLSCHISFLHGKCKWLDVPHPAGQPSRSRSRGNPRDVRRCKGGKYIVDPTAPVHVKPTTHAMLSVQADEAKQELKDVVEFLKSPEKFSALGGKLPKGVLLVGPPGTGKTLLARAVAGEAGVPFFHAAGPEFDEILVGQGARRVRDLFKAAKDRAPCVIFIDEIDSVGAKRTNSVLHPYANQTINQLLSEMDGFHQNEGVIVLGATNRRDDLDKALLRPGRFDVEVNVPTPDYTGRKEILDLYLGKVLSKDVDVEMLARGTTGFTGADLENMVNQAALRAAIDGADSVTMKYLENARDKVLMGPERKSRIPDEEANVITAYHEGGHAIVAYYTKDSHPLHKVTIIPRGHSLGHTAYIPEKERYHVTKSQLLAMMDTMMGGRAAEELVFGPDKITSGASSDLKQATSIATHMVKDWGMSEKVGLRTHEGNNGGYVMVNELSPSTNDQIDSEIKRIMTVSKHT